MLSKQDYKTGMVEAAHGRFELPKVQCEDLRIQAISEVQVMNLLEGSWMMSWLVSRTQPSRTIWTSAEVPLASSFAACIIRLCHGTGS